MGFEFTLGREAFELLVHHEYDNAPTPQNPAEYPPNIFSNRVQLQLRSNAEKIYKNKLQLIVDYFKEISQKISRELAASADSLKEAMQAYGLPVVSIQEETADRISAVYRKELPRERLLYIGEPLANHDLFAAAWNAMSLSNFCSWLLSDMQARIGILRRSTLFFERKIEQISRQIEELEARTGTVQTGIPAFKEKKIFAKENLQNAAANLERTVFFCTQLLQLDLRKMLSRCSGGEKQDSAVPSLQILSDFIRQAVAVLEEHHILPKDKDLPRSWIDSVDFDFSLVAEERPEKAVSEPSRVSSRLAFVIPLNRPPRPDRHAKTT